MPDIPSLPRVVAVLVVHNGEAWIGNALATIAALRYPALDLVVVDSGSTDGSPDLLARRIPEGRLITLPANVGYGRAVTAGLAQTDALEDAELLWLLHDDLALDRNALLRMVRALAKDETLGVVGPKLREWSDEPVLAEVGMTVDRFGRAETQLDPGELDQGQLDRPRDVLYVSTAGMLIRRDVLRGVGGFDARYHVFRDDLDLCWRVWLAGYRVGVVPSAVGYHLAATSRFVRPLGRGRPWEARYLAERNTLATLLKNYGALRLVWVLPVLVALAVAKVIGFVATRRFGDAIAVVRAYVWNVMQLPRTLRRRRHVQRRRKVGDAELVRLFAPGLPRARAYTEAVGEWLAGGSTRVLIDDAEPVDPMSEDSSGWRAFQRTIRQHPAAATAVVLLALYVLGVMPLLGSGQIVGGDVARWPAEARDFLRAYASPWNGEPAASSAFASPVQALLGFASFLGFGSPWAAQRLLVLGLLPLAWISALRAGRLVTSRAGPRALGATLYVLSPVVVGTLAQGRFGILVVATLLPGLLLLIVRAGDPAAPPTSGWRAAALLALGLAVAAAAAPTLMPALAVIWLVAVLRTLLRGRAARQNALRLGAAGAAALGVLAPWLVSVSTAGWSAVAAPAPVAPIVLWRALGIAPITADAFAGAGGVVLAVMTLALVVAAVVLGLRRRPGIVAGLVLVMVLSGLAAWGAGRLGLDVVWHPALLLPAAVAQAGLGVVSARWLVAGLREYSFGLRQLVTVVAAGVLILGIGGSALRLGGGPWDGLTRDPALVPAFVAADGERVGPYRILVLREERGVVRWDLVAGTGPRMTEFGTIRDRRVLAAVDAAVAAAVGGADPTAGDRLGVVNVRYLVVAGDSEPLAAVLARQPSLEPLPAGGADVYRVQTWLPRAVVLPPSQAEALLATGSPGPTADLDRQGLSQVRPGAYEGPNPSPEGGLLVVTEGADSRWRAAAGGAELAPVPLTPVNAFTVPAETARLRVFLAGGVLHRLVLAVQALLVLGIISLALRPPGQGPRAEDALAPGVLPVGIDRLPDAGAGVAPTAPNGGAAGTVGEGSDDEDAARVEDADGSPTGPAPVLGAEEPR
jgi:GT2 family glycosyltransferase